MTAFRDATLTDFRNVQNAILNEIKGATSFEEASQQYTVMLYEKFKTSIVLVRHFATVPYEGIPLQDKNFVDNLAVWKKIKHLLHSQTPILSLLGTSGVEPNWNDRKKSHGHIGVPLISEAFESYSPMIPYLLNQIGMKLEWIDSKDTKLVEESLGLMSGMFFVTDAASETDSKGRKVISFQDFVSKYHVKTVFGFGGGYIGGQNFSVTVIFLRETTTKSQAEHFAALMSRFRVRTADMLKRKIFA